MLAEAISSVLKQSLKELEIIVVDDCSSDGTGDFVRSIPDERVRYFRNDKNIRQEASRMIGLRQARGKYITFLDDDDYYTDYDFFAKAANIFAQHENDTPPIVMVYANADLVNTLTHETSRWNIGKPGRVRGVDDFILGKQTKAPSTFPAVFRADILRKAGLEDKIMFDTLTYIQAALEGDLWFMDEIIGVYRIHGESMTLGYKSTTRERELRHYETLRECMRRYEEVSRELERRKDRRIARKFYRGNAYGMFIYCGIARPRLADRLKTYWCIGSESGFMSRVWLTIPYRKLRPVLRKIPGLRKLYRFIKYRCRGLPYPED